AVALVLLIVVAKFGYDALSEDYIDETEYAQEQPETPDTDISQTASEAETQTGAAAFEASAKETAVSSASAETAQETQAETATATAASEAATISFAEGEDLIDFTGQSQEADSASTAQEGDSSSTTQEAAEPSPDAVPDFEFMNQEGEMVNLYDFLGKPIMLNFWATWCGPCKSEMPYFQDAYERYGDKINFLIVNLTDGSSDTVDGVKAFVNKYGYTFPVGFDVNYDGAYTYGISSIPQTFFIDAAGNLVNYQIGSLPGQSTLDQELDALLGN
nr:TlpA family protein disulfide reductase [Lachnospiraceae bacterium]